MALGTANLKSTLAAGATLAPEQVDDMTTLLARADDETIFDLYAIDPPTSASSTLVNVGIIPLRGGPLVVGDASLRVVHVAPLRMVRSSTSVSTPRRILSAVTSAATIVGLPTVAPSGKWRIELLYAQLSWVDASEPAKGAQITFQWATSPADVNTGTAANVATLPANTSTTWNVAIAYVKNIAARTTVDARDILSPTPSVAGGLDGRLRRRLGAGPGAIDAQRGYSSTLQAIATLAAATGTITDLRTSSKVHKADLETSFRALKIPYQMLVGTSAVDTYQELDDTRDWRFGDFLTFANVPNLISPTILYFGEEDTNTGATNSRQAPSRQSMSATGHADYFQIGSSFEALNGSGSYAQVAAYYTASGDPMTSGGGPVHGAPWFASTDTVRLLVDMSTGKLVLHTKITGAGTGAPVTVFLFATFPNSR